MDPSSKFARSSSHSDVLKSRIDGIADENLPQQIYSNNSADLNTLQIQLDAHKSTSRPLRSPRGLHNIVTSSHESDNTVKMLMLALDEANRKIQEQALEITQQQKEIVSLKLLLRKHSLAESIECSTSPALASGSCSRRRASIQRALQIEKNCLDWPSPDTDSPQVSISQLHPVIDTPTSTPTKLFDKEATILEFNTSPTSAPPTRLVTRLRMDPSQRRRKAAANKKLHNLASKIATISSSEDDASSDRYINTDITPTVTPTISPDNDHNTQPTFTFSWKQLRKECLFIAHDNPKLGQSVNAVLNGMQLCIESKGLVDGVEYAHFIMGRIIYCGAVEHVESSAGHDFSRGSQCLVVTDLSAYRIDLKTAPRRLVGDIMEIDIISGSCGAYTREFFRPCITSRVDVILDPIHSQSWYPYWESMGHRKMAPQFRSTGIGYIRLGDDMSRFGTSFMSYDGFVTFVDEGRSLMSSCPNLTSQLSGSIKSTLNGSTRVGWEDIACLLVTLRENQSSEMKWNERLEKLQTLQSYLVEKVFKWEAQHLGEVSALVEDHLRTNKNPHVLRISVQIVADLGVRVMQLSMAAGNMWKSLITQTVHMLRHANKLVSDAALTTLVGLQETSVSLAIASSIMDDVMLGPQQKSNTSKAPACANTQKVLKWLTGLTDFEFMSALSRPSSNKKLNRSNSETSIESTASSRLKPWCILSRLISVMSHRMEVVRDAACHCAASLLALDIVTFSSTCRHGDDTCTYNFPVNTEAIFETLSSQSRPLLEEIGMAVSPKTQSKVCDLTIKYLRKHSSSTHRQTSTAAQKKPPTKPQAQRVKVENHSSVDSSLGSAWMEARMCLRTIPSAIGEFTWKAFAEIVTSAPAFFTDLSHTASQCQLAPGALLRIVLPFNEETSSGDQADIDLRKSLPSEAVGLPISPLQFYQLRSSAVLIRKTVRAKMADEADLKQVQCICNDLLVFWKKLDELCTQKQLSPDDAIRLLDKL